MQQAFALHDAGRDMLRCRLRREHPNADDRQISQLMGEALRAKPDCDGVYIVPRPIAPSSP